VSVPSHASAMLLLMVAGDYEILTWDENLWHNAIIKFS
jgi:hypothetical protein